MPRRSAFQFHLSTMLVLVLAANILFYLNLRPATIQDVSLNFQAATYSPASDADFRYSAKVFFAGFPFRSKASVDVYQHSDGSSDVVWYFQGRQTVINVTGVPEPSRLLSLADGHLILSRYTLVNGIIAIMLLLGTAVFAEIIYGRRSAVSKETSHSG